MRRIVIAIATVSVGAAGITTGAAARPATPAATPAAVSHPLAAPRAARRVRVPNEIGRNHQAAQDDLQAHGFYNLREKDCTGRGRMLIWDRNWKVVRQSPRAGARVSTDTAVTLCSVKYTDS